MSALVGVIAEEINDVEVVDELIKKILPNKKYSIKKFVGHGCGKLRSKCLQWADNLQIKGCSTLILLHDLDKNDLIKLNSQLCQSLTNCLIPKHVVIIPIKEIEAWLLSDNLAIKRAMNLNGNIKTISNPQSIADPKKKLGEIIYLQSRKTKRYLNTAHNRRIAAELNLVNVRRCNSFLPLEKFIQENIG